MLRLWTLYGPELACEVFRVRYYHMCNAGELFCVFHWVLWARQGSRVEIDLTQLIHDPVIGGEG